MMRNRLILHLLNFFELGDVIQPALQGFIELLTTVGSEIFLINLCYRFIAYQIFHLFYELEVLIDQIIKRVNPRRY